MLINFEDGPFNKSDMSKGEFSRSVSYMSMILLSWVSLIKYFVPNGIGCKVCFFENNRDEELLLIISFLEILTN